MALIYYWGSGTQLSCQHGAGGLHRCNILLALFWVFLFLFLMPRLASNSCQCFCISFLRLCWGKACPLILLALPCWRNDLKVPCKPLSSTASDPPSPQPWPECCSVVVLDILCPVQLGHWGLGCTPDPLPALDFCLCCPCVPRTLFLNSCLFRQFT